jgi:hypothetical protein
MGSALELAGMKIGRLTVVERVEPPGMSHGKVHWRCVCECGNERTLPSDSLTRRQPNKSCGCYRTEARVAHNTTHGQSDRPEYRVWIGMKKRCENPSALDYPRYGGRGIKVASEWHDFAVFYQDVGPRPTPDHSLDRIDNDGDYIPGNVRWATAAEQNANTRVFIDGRANWRRARLRAELMRLEAERKLMLDVIEAVRPLFSSHGPVFGSVGWERQWGVAERALAALEAKS